MHGFFLMIRRPPRSTRTDHTLSLHDALPISCPAMACGPCVHGSGSAPSLVSPSGAPLRATRPSRLRRSEEHTSELQSLMRISYAVFCLKKKIDNHTTVSPSSITKHNDYHTHYSHSHHHHITTATRNTPH